MASFYKPQRHKDWNFDGPKWRLSRSKIDLFIECPRCFYIDNKIGTARPRGYPFNLNSAVDELLKKEFDYYRQQGEPHPKFSEWGVKAIPFSHPKLDEWRHNFSGVETTHEPTGMTICGAVDDLWVSHDGEILVVDYKSTSKEEGVGIDADWQDSYKRQMEVYQWLLRQNGLKVSGAGYFLYANGRRDFDRFDATLHFELSLHAYEGDDTWVEPALNKIYGVLNQDKIPGSSKECEYCQYTQAYFQAFRDNSTAGGVKTKTDDKEGFSSADNDLPKTLFD